MKDNVDKIVISPDLVELQELNFMCALNREDRTAVLFENCLCINKFLHLEGEVEVIIH